MKLFYTFRRRAMQDPLVRLYYHRYRARHAGKRRRWKNGAVLVWLFLLFRVLRADPRRRLSYPESSQKAHPVRRTLLRACKSADRICLDAELLFLRRASQDFTLDVVGQRLGIDDYKTVRAAAAEEADRRQGGTASLGAVCRVLSEWCGVSAERAEREELALERAVRVADPFYLSFLQEIGGQKKRVVVFCEGRLPSELRYW